MRHFILTSLLACSLSSLALPSIAANNQNSSLSTCLVESTTEAQRKSLTQWAYVTLGKSKSLNEFLNVTPAQVEQLNKQTADTFMQLLTDACRSQVQQTVRQQGIGGIQQSFNALGELAGKELLDAPEVAMGLVDISKHINFTQLLLLAR